MKLKMYTVINTWLTHPDPPIFSQADTNTDALAPSSSEFDQVQGQVNEVKVILKDNINKLLERGDRLDDQNDKTDTLRTSVSTQSETVLCCQSHFHISIRKVVESN